MSARSLTVEVANKQRKAIINSARLKKAIRLVLEDAGVTAGEISIAIVGDERMQELNRTYLQHDYPTDVLSFVLARNEAKRTLDGEIIVSAEYAEREAPRYHWTIDDELLLYVIHGSLHLVGYDDTTTKARRSMREAEAKYLERFGLECRR